jgi:hypothetical protein
MSLEAKARENLEAAVRLLAGGAEACLGNACASRAYYAAYQAIVHRARLDGRPFTSNKKRRKQYYEHDRLPRDAREWGLLDESGSETLELLLDARIRADYYEDLIDLEEANEAADGARVLVRELLGDGEAT